MKDYIDFVKLKNLFDPKEWDIAYVSADNFDKGGHKKVKEKFHESGVNWIDNVNATPYNGIILAKYVEETNYYSLYDESEEILSPEYKYNYGQVYVNFKEVALLSGFAHRAKNSLVYNRKFGFQCKLCAYMFVPPIINYEKLEPSTELLDLCNGCDDCIRNCPAAAITEEGVDYKKCDTFIGWGNHPTIPTPSMKWFWYEKIGHKKFSRKEVESWNGVDNFPPFLLSKLFANGRNNYSGGLGWDPPWGKGIDGYYKKDGWKLKKDNVLVSQSHCKECQLQPRCSKAPVLE